MSFNSVVISSGHGLYVRGAAGPEPWGLDEVDEARKVVDRVAQILRDIEYDVTTFHDNTSHDQSTNLSTICNFHNSRTRDLDVSVHFNCYDTTAHGTEVLYVTQDDLAADMSAAIASAGHFTNRGAKYRSDLKFLNSTEMPAILIETAFCDHRGDCDNYRAEFESICRSIAEIISGQEIGERPPIEPPVEPIPPEPEPAPGEVPTVRIETTGKVNVYVNGVLVAGAEAGVQWHENITATVFAGSDDPQDSAYGTGPIDGDRPGVSVPYKWRDQAPPDIIVSGPDGEQRAPTVDVGPWNIDDPDYVLDNERPLVETQYAEGVTAQNGMVPTNDAAIDLTPATAEAVGIEGKGKVKWRFA